MDDYEALVAEHDRYKAALERIALGLNGRRQPNGQYLPEEQGVTPGMGLTDYEIARAALADMSPHDWWQKEMDAYYANRKPLTP